MKKKAASGTPEIPADVPASGTLSPDRILGIGTLVNLAMSPRRSEILVTLSGGERNVGEIVAALDHHPPTAINHELTLLRAGQLLQAARRGKYVHYTLTEKGRHAVRVIFAVAEVIERWEL